MECLNKYLQKNVRNNSLQNLQGVQHKSMQSLDLEQKFAKQELSRNYDRNQLNEDLQKMFTIEIDF